MEKHIIIIAGDPSGDLHCANLVKELKKLNPDLKFSGLGGPKLKEAGVRIYYNIVSIAALGLFDVMKKYPAFRKIFKFLLKKIEKIKPACIIMVDFGGFNLRLAKKLQNKFPIYYYISPQVWASRAGRVKTIKKYVTKMLVIFDFEKKFYKKYGIDAEFVGHPLVDLINPTLKKDEARKTFRLSDNNLTIALLPGSRRTEVKKILPVMLKTARIIKNELKNVQFLIVKSPHVEEIFYEDFIKGYHINLEIVEGKNYDCLNVSDFALVASGTATLETALMEVPFVVIYRMGLLNYLLYRPQVKVPNIGMVNIVAGKKIVDEFVQFGARPKRIANRVIEILKSKQKTDSIKKKLESVKSHLGASGAASRAAKIILDSLT